MERKVTDLLKTLVKVQEFLASHAAALAPALQCARRRLDAAVASLTMCTADTEHGARAARAATKKVRELRARVQLEHVRPIALIAKRCLPNVPEAALMKLPPGGISTGQFVVRADLMIEAAVRHAFTFIDEFGMRPDFLVRFEADVRALERAISRRDWLNARAVVGAARHAAAIAEARSTIKIVDALLSTRLHCKLRQFVAWNDAVGAKRTA
jgi:hypothetical protein